MEARSGRVGTLSMAIAQEEFEYLRRFIFANSAMVLDEEQSYVAESRLSKLVYQEGVPSIRDLVRQLKLETNGPLQRKVIDALTNHETWFFRDVAPFELLRTVLLPEMQSRKRTGEPVTIWSAAASSGQEASSIAMTARELWMDAEAKVRIIATDVSQPVLERARLGRYSQLEINRGLPAVLLARYFRRDGLEWEVLPEIRRMIDYRWLNLAEPWPSMPALDIVFLRNVMIYFDQTTKRTILERVYRVLQPGGVLVLGGAETTLGLHDGFVRVPSGKTSYYQKPR